MKYLIFLAALVAQMMVVDGAFALPKETMEKIDQVLTQQVNSLDNVGIVVGLIENGQHKILRYGKTTLTSTKAPDETSVFEIGSITKVFTAITLESLVQDHTLQLEDHVSKFIPELNGFPAGDITLKQLATHTSGLPRIPNDQYLHPADPLDPYRDFTATDLLAYLKSLKNLNPPTEYDVNNYSNTGFALLGYVLSRATKTPYEGLVRQRVLSPLKMQDTSIDLSASRRTRFLQGYNSVIEPVPAWDFNIFAGAGALRSTVGDLMKFVDANLGLSSASILPILSASQEKQVGGQTENIGLAWQLDLGDGVVWHNGETYGFYGLIALDRTKKLGLVVLSNTGSGVQCIQSLVFGKDCSLPAEYALSTSQLDAFTGRYMLSPQMALTITRNESFLVAQATGQEKLRMRALDPLNFNLADGLAKVTFNENTEGQVVSLTLLQAGKSLIAKFVGRP